MRLAPQDMEKLMLHYRQSGEGYTDEEMEFLKFEEVWC